MRWRPATVIENKSASADGQSRLLTLSVEDPIIYLEGLTFDRRKAEPRWIDEYKAPGQFIAVRLGSGEGTSEGAPKANAPATNSPDTSAAGPSPSNDNAKSSAGTSSTGNGGSSGSSSGSASSFPHIMADVVLPIASSPFGARAESAMLDASIIELLVGIDDTFNKIDKDEKAEGEGDIGRNDSLLFNLQPGDQLQVSEILGRGYTGLVNPDVCLTSVLQNSRAMVVIAGSARGMGPLRAAMEWLPVQAAATQQAVTIFPITTSMESAAFLPDWDTWRENGVEVKPIYLEDLPGYKEDSSLVLKDAIEEIIFDGGNLAKTLKGASPRTSAFLIGGLPPSIVMAVTRRLKIERVPQEGMLFCEMMN